MSSPTTLGPERLLVLGYGLFVVAAGARAAVQLGTDAGRAPVAYTLSALAAVVYAAGFLAVGRAARGDGRAAAGAVAITELAGVLGIGVVTTVDPDVFGDATVWSYFGAGYLFVPLVVPVAVLVWIRRDERSG